MRWSRGCRILRFAATSGAVVFTPTRGAWAQGSDWAHSPLFDVDEPTLLALCAALAILASLLTWLLRDVARTSDRRPDMRDLGAVELAYCASGPARAADALYLTLASRGVATVDGSRIVVRGPTPSLPPQLEEFAAALAGRRSRRRFATAFRGSTPYFALLDRLVRRKIVLGPKARARLALATWLPGSALLAFGMAEVVSALARGEAFWMLLAFNAVVLVTLLTASQRERYLTREALASLAALRADRSRTTRRPPEDVAYAFAMLGAVALDGTAHAAFAELLRSPAARGRRG